MGKKKIIAVDDRPETLELYQLMLGDIYELRLANSGFELLDMVKEDKPDLLLMDMMMPEMNGAEALIKLAEIPGTRTIKVIFLSSMFQTEEELKKLRVYGTVQYLSKPISKPDLLKAIEKAFKQ